MTKKPSKRARDRAFVAATAAAVSTRKAAAVTKAVAHAASAANRQVFLPDGRPIHKSMFK